MTKNLQDISISTKLFLDQQQDEETSKETLPFTDNLLPMDHTIAIIADYPQIFLPLLPCIDKLIATRSDKDLSANIIPVGSPTDLGKGIYRLILREWMAPYHLHYSLHMLMEPDEDLRTTTDGNVFFSQHRHSIIQDYEDFNIQNLQPSARSYSLQTLIRLIATELYIIEHEALRTLSETHRAAMDEQWYATEASTANQLWLPTKILIQRGGRFAKFGLTKFLNDLDNTD
jgi:hypothetical protein